MMIKHLIFLWKMYFYKIGSIPKLIGTCIGTGTVQHDQSKTQKKNDQKQKTVIEIFNWLFFLFRLLTSCHSNSSFLIYCTSCHYA